MKTLDLTLLLIFTCNFGFAQNKEIDSLKHELEISKIDTSHVLIFVNLCDGYRTLNPDYSQIYVQRALDLAKKVKFIRGEALERVGELNLALSVKLKYSLVYQLRPCQKNIIYCLSNKGHSFCHFY